MEKVEQDDLWIEKIEAKKNEVLEVLNGLSYSDCQWVIRHVSSATEHMSILDTEKKEG